MAVVLSAWCPEHKVNGSQAPFSAQQGNKGQGTVRLLFITGFLVVCSGIPPSCPPGQGTTAMSFLCGTGAFVSGKDKLIFHFSGREQRQFLCRDLILDLFSVPRLPQAIALGNRLDYGKEFNEKLALVRVITTNRRLWRNTAEDKASTGKSLCWPR